MNLKLKNQADDLLEINIKTRPEKTFEDLKKFILKRIEEGVINSNQLIPLKLHEFVVYEIFGELPEKDKKLTFKIHNLTELQAKINILREKVSPPITQLQEEALLKLFQATHLPNHVIQELEETEKEETVQQIIMLTRNLIKQGKIGLIVEESSETVFFDENPKIQALFKKIETELRAEGMQKVTQKRKTEFKGILTALKLPLEILPYIDATTLKLSEEKQKELFRMANSHKNICCQDVPPLFATLQKDCQIAIKKRLEEKYNEIPVVFFEKLTLEELVKIIQIESKEKQEEILKNAYTMQLADKLPDQIHLILATVLPSAFLRQKGLSIKQIEAIQNAYQTQTEKDEKIQTEHKKENTPSNFFERIYKKLQKGEKSKLKELPLVEISRLKQITQILTGRLIVELSPELIYFILTEIKNEREIQNLQNPAFRKILPYLSPKQFLITSKSFSEEQKINKNSEQVTIGNILMAFGEFAHKITPELIQNLNALIEADLIDPDFAEFLALKYQNGVQFLQTFHLKAVQKRKEVIDFFKGNFLKFKENTIKLIVDNFENIKQKTSEKKELKSLFFTLCNQEKKLEVFIKTPYQMLLKSLEKRKQPSEEKQIRASGRRIIVTEALGSTNS